jgi:hypothetical protein
VGRGRALALPLFRLAHYTVRSRGEAARIQTQGVTCSTLTRHPCAAKIAVRAEYPQHLPGAAPAHAATCSRTEPAVLAYYSSSSPVTRLLSKATAVAVAKTMAAIPYSTHPQGKRCSSMAIIPMRRSPKLSPP